MDHLGLASRNLRYPSANPGPPKSSPSPAATIEIMEVTDTSDDSGAGGVASIKIGRAHVRPQVTAASHMPSSA